MYSTNNFKKLYNNLKPTEIIHLLKQWNVSYYRTISSVDISGSPERTLCRIVVEDIDGEQYILERISKDQRDRKAYISRVLKELNKLHVSYVHSYLLTRNKEYFVVEKEIYWQLRPYIAGIPLKRPEYFMDAWRGKKTALFLNELKKKSRMMETSLQKQSFSLNKYINDMIPTMRCYNPRVFEQIQPIFTYLKQGLFKVYDLLPQSFCHGDLHVLNIIWSKNDILSVIDWEFCGMKIELYDIANFLSCIGIEHPNGLLQDMSLSFIYEMYNENIISNKSAVHLIDCMIAIRFAWLSEWLRKQDNEMITLEITYMYLLMNQKDFISHKWNESIGKNNYF